VVAHLGRQLGAADPTSLARYLDRPATHREHAGEIRRRYGYRDFTDQPEHFHLVRWLFTRAWFSAERPSLLFDLATARLVESITLTGLDKLAEPASLITLREQVAALLPRVDLPEALLEIQARTGFASEFTHISEGAARVTDLTVSLFAVLLAEACNIGLEPLVRADTPALTRGRLAWVQ
jgi:hypothetical protein